MLVDVWKKSTVWIASAIGTGVVAWQVPEVQDVLRPYLAAHPHVASVLTACVALWLLRHRPTRTLTK